MTLVAGVDSSTQSCKVVVVDAESGAVVREGRAGHPDGTAVHPDFWWDALREALAGAGGLADVAAVSIGGQQHGMVLLDAEGRVIREALLWNDTRSAEAAAQLVSEVGAEQYAARTGVVPVASFTATKLRWVRDHEPQNAARVAAVCLPHDWLTWRLRGYGPADAADAPLGPDLEQLTTDRSDASGTAYFSTATGEYDLELFERALGRPGRAAGSLTEDARVVLPHVLGPADTAGAVLGTNTIVGAGAGDNAAAALGLGAELEAAMARHVGGYFDEWKETLDDPEKLARFVSFVNAPDVPDPHISFREERGQSVPADSAGPVSLGTTIPVGPVGPVGSVGAS